MYLLTLISDGDTVSQSFESWEETERIMKSFVNGKMDVECHIEKLVSSSEMLDDAFEGKGEARR